jgi:uncharacterized protein (TIGR00251 family)
MIKLETHDEGVVLSVRAQPGARKNGIQGEHAGMLKVSVTQAREKGKANKAIEAILAEELNLRSSQIELISGETASQKRFLIRGATIKNLTSRLNELLGAG